jgi:DNA-binding protein HU-beta
MKKSDIVILIAERQNIPQSQVEVTIDAFLNAVAEGLARDEKVDFRGFGAFAVRTSAARAGRNPRTGEVIQIAARKTPTFKVGKELKERVNASRPNV